MLSVLGTESNLIVFPQNTASVSGSSATLHCSSNFGGDGLYWMFENTVIVIDCSPITAVFSVNKSTSEQCDLVIVDVQLLLSGNYTCFEANAFDAQYAGALLTVIGLFICF